MCVKLDFFKLILTNRPEILQYGLVSMTIYVCTNHDLMMLPGLALDESTPEQFTVGI